MDVLYENIDETGYVRLNYNKNGNIERETMHCTKNKFGVITCKTYKQFIRVTCSPGEDFLIDE